jgi:hypothetical protein
MTPLDRAHVAAEAPGATPDARTRFYALLLESTLFVPVEPTAPDAPLKPLVFDLEDGAVALAFDDDARMAEFFGAATDYVSLPGSAVVAALSDAAMGLGLNLGETPSATLLDADAVRWLAQEMGGGVATADLSGALTLAPPAGAEPGLLAALAERLAQFPGLIEEARLARLGPEGAPGRLTLLLLPRPAAARAAKGLADALGRAAAPHAPRGEDVAIGVLAPAHPLLDPARRLGVDLLSRPDAQPAPRAAISDAAQAPSAAERKPPILR